MTAIHTDMAGKYLYLCRDMYQVRSRKAPQALEEMWVWVSVRVSARLLVGALVHEWVPVSVVGHTLTGPH